MRKLTSLILVCGAIAISPALAANEPAKPAEKTAPAAPAASTPAAIPKYTTEDTDLGTLLDDPVAKAIVEKHIPGLTTNDQIEMARGMTLKMIQSYAADTVTDERLLAIDAEFAKLPK